VCHPKELDAWLIERQLLHQVIQQQLTRASQRMKHQADKHRSEREFAVGDLVYLKLQPHIQTSVATRANQKLAYRYFGPYQVLERVGSVAYKLNLPATAKIHPVVHVSQLKKHIPPAVEVSEHLPPAVELSEDSDMTISQLTPARFLDSRMVKTGTSTQTELLVQWMGWPTELSSWEEAFDLRRRFPDAPAWGQAGFEGVGIVMCRKRNNKQKKVG
jgi:hypothetical protein